MPRLKKFLFAAIILCGSLVFAQTSDQSTAAPEQPRGNPGRRDQVEGRLRHMSKQLNLTDDQKEKIKPILQQEADQVKTIQADTSLTPQQKRKKTHEVRRQFQPQIQAVLTPEQKEKLQEMRGGQHQRHNWQRSGSNGGGSDKPDSSQQSTGPSTDKSDPQ